MKVVVDTNVLVSGIFWGGVPLKILDLWRKQDIEVVASDLTLDEYLKVIFRIAQKVDRLDLYREWAFVLSSNIKIVAIKKSFHLCRDHQDDKFIDSAIAGRAHYLVSGDSDLLVLGIVMRVKILNPRDFLKLLHKTV